MNVRNFRYIELYSRGECTCWEDSCPGGEYGGSLPLSGGLSGNACLTRNKNDNYSSHFYTQLLRQGPAL